MLSAVYQNGSISIPNVTGDIVISVSASPLVIDYITAVFNPGQNKIYSTDSLDVLKQYLVVAAVYTNGSSAAVGDSDYILSGSLTPGEATITVSYANKQAVFNVNVTLRGLYPIADASYKNSSQFDLSVENDNHIAIRTYANSRSIYCTSTGNVDTWKSNSVQNKTWFSLTAGDSYVLRIKNFEFSNSTFSSGTNTFELRILSTDAATAIINTGTISITTTSEVSGSLADMEFSGTIANSATAGCMYFTVLRSVQISLDLELYVNGIRYV